MFLYQKILIFNLSPIDMNPKAISQSFYSNEFISENMN